MHFHKLYLCLFIFSNLMVAQKAVTDSISTELQVPIEVKGNSLPTDLLFKKSKVSNFTISPDGKFFAKIMENNIETDIIVVDIDGYKLHNRIPLGEKSVQDIHWITSNRILYESLGAIYAIDIDGSNQKTIVNRLTDNPKLNWSHFYKNFRFNNVVDLLPERKDEILIETFDYKGFSTIKRVNIFTGEKYVVQSGARFEISKWLTDYTGAVKLGIKVDDQVVRYMIQDVTGNRWLPLNVTIEGNTYPLEIQADSYLSQNLNFEGFSYREDQIFLSSNIGSDLRKLLRYDLKKQEVKEVVVEDINCDISDPHGYEAVLIMDSHKKILAGVRYVSLTPKYKWFSEEFQILHDELSEKYPSYVNDIIDIDGSKKRFLIHQWSDINAGNIGVYDTTDGSYIVMFHFNEELNKYKLSRTKCLIIPARDGKKLPSYLNLPTGYTDKKQIPMVVIPHGGPWTRDYWELDGYSQYFASRGYAALRVNYRGSTGFGKKHVKEGLSGINEVMINDIADATEFVKSKFNIDSSTVFLFGHSYGGYATYMGLLQYPKLYAAGVAVSAPSDIKLWMKTQRKEKNDFAYEFWKVALGNKGKSYFSEISPINHASQFKNPVLIFHGKLDRIIAVEHAELMAEELQEFNKEVTLRIIQDEGHSIWDSHSAGYILEQANEFFQKNQAAASHSNSKDQQLTN